MISPYLSQRTPTDNAVVWVGKCCKYKVSPYQLQEGTCPSGNVMRIFKLLAWRRNHHTSRRPARSSSAARTIAILSPSISVGLQRIVSGWPVYWTWTNLWSRAAKSWVYRAALAYNILCIMLHLRWLIKANQTIGKCVGTKNFYWNGQSIVVVQEHWEPSSHLPKVEHYIILCANYYCITRVQLAYTHSWYHVGIKPVVMVSKSWGC
jgi:hypothetical protein